MFYIGIDIGSTATKVSVLNEDNIIKNIALPTGWNSKETAKSVEEILKKEGFFEKAKIVATGYGRVSVPYAHKTVTEISCHARGVYHLTKKDFTVIDIGGQDTKVIELKNGQVASFLMNDKCAAGTGRFLELMANILGLTLEEMTDLARKGESVQISSMCTVFAESEVISLIGNGEKRENICAGVIDSVINRVYCMVQKTSSSGDFFLTGGLCENDYIVERLSKKLGKNVKTDKLARFAGSIGAALFAKNI